jgi:hypothetical protein
LGPPRQTHSFSHAHLHQAIEAKVERNLLQHMEVERERARSVFLHHEIDTLTRASQAQLQGVQRECEGVRAEAERECEAMHAELEQVRKAVIYEQSEAKALEVRLYACQQDRGLIEAELRSMSEFF